MAGKTIQVKKTTEHVSTWWDRFNVLVTAIQGVADFGVSVLNGIVGDYLVAQQNDLAIRMQFVKQNKLLPLTSESLRAAYPNLTPKICILVHGLSTDERIWNFRDGVNKTYGTLLQQDLGITPFYVRFNSGLHISENGKKLAQLIADLIEAYPIPVEDIIFLAHSMGGLVTRSACYYGSRQAARWVTKVRKLFFLGTPHRGAPLEKVGNVFTNILKFIPRPYTHHVADIINIRSSGIKDLRFGYLVDEDWTGYNPDSLLQNNQQPIPLLAGAAHYIVSGTLTEDPDHYFTLLFGDGMVRKSSVLGQARQKGFQVPFDPDNHKEFPKIRHIKLAHSPQVYEQIKIWCQETAND
ncbi:esterase/lipase family protein [candidate division CSSED10-310 bacterium]|uniref:Esterase/lipase family protein n=1 Tax=candidate division CSSED10-310 bacterium TaxID=2855610 RepID=A0ABV6YUR6_UNCC1